MVTEMVEADVREAQKDELLRSQGFRVFQYWE